MAQELATTNKFQVVLYSEAVQNRFTEILDKGAASFVSALLSIYNGNPQLQKCSTRSILGAAGLAATVKLPLNPSFGFAYIVPYGAEAQFQIGWKGLVQLAHRTGQYVAMTTKTVFEGEIKEFDFLTELPIRGEKISDKIVGYLAYFKLANGFEKCLYMTVEEIRTHAQNFSKSYSYDLKSGKKSSVWSSNFDAMAKKTVLKLLLGKWGIVSVEMQQVMQADQSVVDKNTFTYADNGGKSVEREPLEVSDAEMPAEIIDAETGEILTPAE